MENEHPLWDEIYKRIGKVKDISDIEDLYTDTSKVIQNTLINQMLIRDRNYIINEVKAPLMDAIVNFKNYSLWGKTKAIFRMPRILRGFPVPTKANTKYKNTHITLDIIDKFNKLHRNPLRKPLFDGLHRVVVDECEHDGYYASIRDWWIEEIILAILAGEWAPRPKNWPENNQSWTSTWLEKRPYGGEESIVYKLQQHRQEILRLIND